jgi:hypothetical protein
MKKVPKTIQRVEKLLYLPSAPCFQGLKMPFRSVLALFRASFGPPTGPTTTFSTAWIVLGTSPRTVEIHISRLGLLILLPLYAPPQHVGIGRR